MMMRRRSGPRRRALALFVLLLILVGSVVAYASRDEIEERVVEPAPAATPLPPQPEVSPEERAYYAFMAPRLAAMIAEANELVALGQERSRNVVQLQIRADRVTSLADAIDEYLAVNPAPPRIEPIVAEYRSAIETVRTGIDDSRSAVLRFDWDGVATGLDLFASGVEGLDRVLADLQAIVARPATPVAAAVLQSRPA